MLKRVRWAEFALELQYSWYKPAAIAFTKVVAESEPPLTDEVLEALSTRANAYLPLTPLEAVGFEETTPDHDTDWWTSLPTEQELFSDEPLMGPRDGYVSAESIDRVRLSFQATLDEEKAHKEQS